MSWSVLDGRLTAASGGLGGLRYDMPAPQALNLVYFAATEWADAEQLAELDSWCSVTSEQLASWEAEQRDERFAMLAEFGEVA